MTQRLLTWVGQQSVKRVFAAIAEEAGLDEKIWRPRCVLTNVETRTIIDLLPDRSKASVAQGLFTLQNKATIRYAAMDMWTPYRDAVRAVLPKATIVVDKFHVVRMANYGVERVRKSLRESISPKERRGLMHDRFILLRRERDLDASSRLLLQNWIGLYPELGVAYRLKEGFYRIYEAPSRAEAQRRYEEWVEQITPAMSEAFRPLTMAWKNWNVEIHNHFEHGVTNAYTESLNSLIRVVNRTGRGYSFEALRAKMLFTEGLHKVERPKFERRAGNGISAFMRVPGDALGMMTPDELFGEPGIYGTDISTLARRIESGRF
jgi:transposase